MRGNLKRETEQKLKKKKARFFLCARENDLKRRRRVRSFVGGLKRKMCYVCRRKASLVIHDLVKLFNHESGLVYTHQVELNNV